MKAGFLPNISGEGKDFVATWFPGFPLLSRPEVYMDMEKVMMMEDVTMFVQKM